jgi:outer membrane protein
MTRRLSKLVVLFLFVMQVGAQVEDTVALDETTYLLQLLKNAPSVQNSSLQIDLANQEWLEARGAFEPKVRGSFALKKFDNKTYYNKLNTELKVQTPFGVSFGGGFSDNFGVFLNPENGLPVQGLAYAGVEVPLGAGMFTNAARTEVKRQALERDAAAWVYTLDVNDYMLQAGEAYWEWYGSIMLIQLANDALLLAENRFELVNKQYKIGETAAIDTLEAFINYQSRQAYYIENLLKYQKYDAYIRNFVWDSSLNTVKLAPQVDLNYQAVFADSLLSNSLISSHPAIKLIETDSLLNRASLALAKEYFKPELDLEFKLQEAAADFTAFNFSPSQNHYVGLNFSMPILLRKQRAKASQLGFKETMINNKKMDLLTKIGNNQQMTYQNSTTLMASIALFEQTAINYESLVKAEQAKFNLGEGSLFMVNSREIKWIEAREKFIKNYVAYRLEVLKYYHSLGVLPEIITKN